jgi:hypothetical protein
MLDLIPDTATSRSTISSKVLSDFMLIRLRWGAECVAHGIHASTILA